MAAIKGIDIIRNDSHSQILTITYSYGNMPTPVRLHSVKNIGPSKVGDDRDDKKLAYYEKEDVGKFLPEQEL